MEVNIFDVMSSKYTPPSSGYDYQAETLPHLATEDDKFYLKVINP